MPFPVVVAADDKEAVSIPHAAVSISHAAVTTLMSRCNMTLEEVDQLLFHTIAKGVHNDRVPPRELAARLETLHEAMRGVPQEVAPLAVPQ